MASNIKQTAKWMSGAGAIVACVAFTPTWEGMDLVAKRDRIGTGHPITYCNGLTSADGAVKVGQRFTKKECDEALAKALPKYWEQISPCIHAVLPDKTAGSLLDGAWNAGPGRVCSSPMLAKMNAGDIRGGCNAFAGWIIRSDGQVRAGLEDRRNGEDHGDKRLSEKGLCLQGLKEGISNGNVYEHAAKIINERNPHVDSVAAELVVTPVSVAVEDTCDGPRIPRASCMHKTVVHKKHILKPHVVVCTGFLWFKECK